MRSPAITVPILLLSALAGCATYTQLPLPTQPNLVSSPAMLTAPVTAFDTPGAHVIHVDLTKPLDAAAVAALAVLNNPTLSVLRAQQGVATAQSYAAGLVPWPQIGLGVSHPAPESAGLHTGWSASVSEAFAALLQHADAEDAARVALTRQVVAAGNELKVTWRVTCQSAMH